MGISSQMPAWALADRKEKVIRMTSTKALAIFDTQEAAEQVMHHNPDTIVKPIYLSSATPGEALLRDEEAEESRPVEQLREVIVAAYRQGARDGADDMDNERILELFMAEALSSSLGAKLRQLLVAAKRGTTKEKEDGHET